MSDQYGAGLLQTFNRVAPSARCLGILRSYVDERQVVIGLLDDPNLDRALGGVHDEVWVTMLGSTGWLAAAAVRLVSRWLATSEMPIR